MNETTARIWMTLSVLLLVVLSACGSAPTSPTGNTASPAASGAAQAAQNATAEPGQSAGNAAASEPSATTSTAASSSAAASVAAQKGGELTIGSIEEPETLNPYITQLATSANVLSGIMEGLLQYDSQQQLRPSLAESYEVAEDGLTYTFKLRQGVKWHDGEAFDAEDVVATWKIITDPNFGAFSQLGWEKIEDIETPDQHTVVMKTTEKYAPFISYVGAGTISPEHQIAKGVDAFKQEFGRNPVGTGPFKFVRWPSGQFIELEKNADYWGGEPNLDKITYKIVPNDNTLLVQLSTGEVQLTPDISAIRYEEAKALPNSQVLERNSQSWYHIDLKNIDFLMDKRVRQALDYATPSQEIIDRLLKGLAVPAVADQAPGTAYYNANIQPRPYDLDQAAQLLQEAGFTKGADGTLEKDGKPFELEYWIPSGDQQTKQIQQVVAASWRKLGIKVDTREEDIQSIWGPNGYQSTEKMTAAAYSWFNSNDPDDAFYWASSQIPSSPTGTGGNLPAYFNKYSFQQEIDELTAQGAQEVDPEKRKQIYNRIQELLHEEVPAIFMYWPKALYVAPKNLTGFDPSAFNGLLWNAEAWSLQQ